MTLQRAYCMECKRLFEWEPPPFTYMAATWICQWCLEKQAHLPIEATMAAKREA